MKKDELAPELDLKRLISQLGLDSPEILQFVAEMDEKYGKDKNTPKVS